jgi:cytochrome P450
MGAQRMTIYYDPYSVEIDADPYPVWKRMRDEAPLYCNERFDFYALSRFEDVRAASLAPRTFVSGHGTVLEMITDEPSDFPILLWTDPPVHDSQRRLVSRAFTPRRVAELEPWIRQLCSSILDELVPEGSFDFLQDFAAQIPSRVISHLVGVDPEDQEAIRLTIDESFHLDPETGQNNPVSQAASARLREYLADLRDRRTAEPRADLMSALVSVEMDVGDGRGPQRLSPDHVVAFVNEITAAGTETVARMLGWAAVLLERNPEQRRLLVEDRSLLPGAVEETLRYEPPSAVQARWVAEEVELYGTTLPVGTRLLLLTGSAGHDERAYEDPDRFDVTRPTDRHLSFGLGVHFCLGASLARLEGRVALDELLSRIPEWEIDYGRAVRLHTSTVRGYHHLPISF